MLAPVLSADIKVHNHPFSPLLSPIILTVISLRYSSPSRPTRSDPRPHHPSSPTASLSSSIDDGGAGVHLRKVCYESTISSPLSLIWAVGSKAHRDDITPRRLHKSTLFLISWFLRPFLPPCFLASFKSRTSISDPSSQLLHPSARQVLRSSVLRFLVPAFYFVQSEKLS